MNEQPGERAPPGRFDRRLTPLIWVPALLLIVGAILVFAAYAG